jgi:hypothetical protein
MVLGEVDRRFLAYRRERSRFGLWALPTALVCLLAIWAGIWAYLPLAVNPWTVIGRIEAKEFEPGTLTMYAVMFTVLVNVVFVLLGTFLVFAMLWLRRERRYFRMTNAATTETSGVDAGNPTVP